MHSYSYLVVACWVLHAVNGMLDLEAVETLDMEAYSGRWYQMYASSIPNRMEEDVQW